LNLLVTLNLSFPPPQTDFKKKELVDYFSYCTDF